MRETMPGFHGDHDQISGESIEMDMRRYNQMEEGVFEVVDTQPKKEYYMSLRRPLNTIGSYNGVGGGGSLYGDGVSGNGVSGLNETMRHHSATLLSQPGSVKSAGSKWSFKLSKKMVESMVIMLDGTEQIFKINPSASGQQLFDAICNHLELYESQFFGITYRDKKNNWYWLKMNRPISKQLSKRMNWQFEFQVRFYPYDIDSIKEDLTRYYLTLQVRQDIVSGQLPCSFYVYALLAGYIVQSEAGDHDPKVHIGIEYIRDHPFAPQSLQTPEMMTQIVAFHKRNRGQAPQEADRNFLNNARKLALYGVDLHRIKFKQEDASLGVNHEGIVIYHNRLVLHRFSWPSIVRLGYRGPIFNLVVDLRDKMASMPGNEDPASMGLESTERTFKLECANQEMAKRTFRTCKDRHEFFRLTRAPRKASLLPTFASRKYQFSGRYFGPYSADDALSPAGANVPRTQGKFSRMPHYRHWDDNNGFGEQYDFNPCIPNHSPSMLKTLPQHHSTPFDQGYFSNVDTMRTTAAATPQVKVQTWQQNGVFPTMQLQQHQQQSRPQMPKCGWRVSMSDRSERLGIDQTGLDVEGTPGWGWQGCRANMGVKGPGGYYFEMRILMAGLVRVGWSTNDSDLNCGMDACGFAYGSSLDSAEAPLNPKSGIAMHNKQPVPYGPVLKEGDVVGCYLDLDKGSVFWSVGKTVYTRCFTVPSRIRDETFIPSVSLNGARVLLNFGLDQMEYRPKDPYFSPVALCQQEHQLPNRNVGWRMNVMDATEHMDVSAHGLTVQSKLGMGWQAIRANRGVHGHDRFYYECQPLEVGGKCRIGWSLEDGSLVLGTDKLGFGYGADFCSSPDSANYSGIDGQQSKLVFGGDITPAGPAVQKGDVIGCSLDLVDRRLRWSRNGQIVREADVSLEKFLAQAEKDSPLLPVVFFPSVAVLDGTAEINFGSNTFKHYPGNEFRPLSNLDDAHYVQSKRRIVNYGTRGWSYFDPCIANEDIKAHTRIGQEAAVMGANRAVERQESEKGGNPVPRSNSQNYNSSAAMQAELAAAMAKRRQQKQEKQQSSEKPLSSVGSTSPEPVSVSSYTAGLLSNGAHSTLSPILAVLPAAIATDATTIVERSDPEVTIETVEQPDGSFLSRMVTKTKVTTRTKYSQISTEPSSVFCQEAHLPQPPPAVPPHGTSLHNGATYQNGSPTPPPQATAAQVDSGAKLRCNNTNNHNSSHHSLKSDSPAEKNKSRTHSDAELQNAIQQVLSLDTDSSLIDMEGGCGPARRISLANATLKINGFLSPSSPTTRV